jgi:hypothetical protein
MATISSCESIQVGGGLGIFVQLGAAMGTAQRPSDAISETRSYAFEKLVAEQLVGHTLEEVERALILRTLDDFEGNRTRTAVALGISVRCLRDKLRHFRNQGFAVPGPNSSELVRKSSLRSDNSVTSAHFGFPPHAKRSAGSVRADSATNKAASSPPSGLSRHAVCNQRAGSTRTFAPTGVR